MLGLIIFICKKLMSSMTGALSSIELNTNWTHLKTISEAEQFISSKDIAVIGFFQSLESRAALSYLAVALFINKDHFGVTTSNEVFAEYGANTDAIMLFKKTDELKSVLQGEATVENIQTFIHVYSLPLINDFNQETAPIIFNGIIKAHLLIFLSKKSDDYRLINPLSPLALRFRGDVAFVFINFDESNDVIYNFFGIINKNEPTYRLMHFQDDIIKYKPETNDLSPGAIATFLGKFTRGQLKQDLLSQDLPEDWDQNPVKILVASKFDEIAFDATKNVLVVFFAPWCIPCKQIDPIINELAERYKNDNSVIIAKIDSTLNDLEHTKIRVFPTIKLYRKGDNEVIDYNMGRTLQDFLTFLNSADKKSDGNLSEDTSSDEDVEYFQDGQVKEKKSTAVLNEEHCEESDVVKNEKNKVEKSDKS